MTNKELQEYLKEFPNDMEVLLDRNGCIYTEVSKPYTKFMGTLQKSVIVLNSSIKV